MPGGVIPERENLVVAAGNVKRIGCASSLCVGDDSVLGRTRHITPCRPCGIGLGKIAAGSVGVKIVTEDNRLCHAEQGYRHKNCK